MKIAKPDLFAVAILLLGILTVVFFTHQGPLVNEDYEKIQLNQAHLNRGTLFEQTMKLEAGFEKWYYRPLNNAVVGLLHRTGGITKAPFRAFGAICFGLAILAVYALARALNLGAGWGLASASFFAAHPFNSWYWFQGSWIGNSLLIFFLALTALNFIRIMQIQSISLKQGLLLSFTAYLACLSKETATLILLMLLPFIPWIPVEKRRIYLKAAGACAVGISLYIVQRGMALGAEQVMPFFQIMNAIQHFGACLMQYFFYGALGANLIYARPLWTFGGWPFTILVCLFILAMFILVIKKDRSLAFLYWCMVVSLIEIPTGSAVSYYMSPSRLGVFLPLFILTTALILKPIFTHQAKRIVIGSLILLLGMGYAFQSAKHVWASMNEQRFYNYHNQSSYNWKTLFIEGRWHSYEKRWTKAVDSFNQSNQITPSYPAFNNQGIALASLGKIDEAIEFFETALQIKPDNATSLNNLGYALEQVDRKEEAYDVYVQSIALDAKTNWARDNLMRLVKEKLERGEFQDLGQLISSVPTDARTQNALGVVLAKHGQNSQAILCFLAAISSKPAFVEAHNNIGIAYAKKGNFTKARLHFNQALILEPNSESVKANMNQLEDLESK
jgi:Flp pilus assembly protein TadD